MAVRKNNKQQEAKQEAASTLQTGDVVGVADVQAAEPDTVCICANIPFDLRFDYLDDNGKMQSLTVKGNGSHLRGLDRGILPVGAYGITANVPKAVWNKVKAVHRDNRAIKNGLIFATEASKAAAATKERKDLRNGLEPIHVEG